VKKNLYSILLFLTGIALFGGCNTKKNTTVNRRFHALTARYNTYFNGKTSFDEALESLQNGYKENYTGQVLMFPVSSLPKDKSETGGPFDRAIEKGNKAVKQHSIQQKPPRKPGWRNDPKQVAWQGKNEYNPFLKHCWLLVGQGQFYNADFLQASATFSYITRHYADDKEMVAEARIWQARCYSEINWLHESGSILDNLKENGFPQANQNQFDRVYADYLIKSNQLEQAVPYLQKAVRSEKNKRQRTRMRYLLGQIYTETGQNEAAYQTFRKVVSSNPPYELEFAARIRQTEVFPGKRYQDVLKMLGRMAKSEKNKDYLDQVYYAIGNIYLERQDTAKAIENYASGIEKSTQNGLDKAILQIRLGDIYFAQKDYINAQPCFSGAMAGIYKEYKDYNRVSGLSAVLDELVVHVEAIHLQDSLQALSELPEEELLALIDKKIEEVKEKEEEEAAELEKQRYLTEQESMGSSPRLQERRMGDEPGVFMPGTGGGGFYFYNEQTVAQGKTQFQNKWGKRALEDLWRLRKKPSGIMQASAEGEPIDGEFAMTFDEEGNPVETTDSLQSQMDLLASDPKSREYYLQQIPFSEEDKEASNRIIADGLFHSGMIYKDKFENKPLAVETFEELDQRFPENEYRLDYYFQSFLMGLQYHDDLLRDKYKQKLAATFPESDYAIAASDPNYEYNIRMMDIVQDSLYESTYNNYLASNITEVRQNYKKFGETCPLSKLMPKFMFVEALTYVQEGDADGFKTALDSLLKRYPREDVSELANEMLKGLLRGRTLVQGGFGTMKWNIRFGFDGEGMFASADSALAFVDKPDAPHHLILIFETGSIDRNQLLYAVAAYNFAKFEVKTFDLQMEEMGSLSIFDISGFSHLDEVLEYTQMIFEPDGYAHAIAGAVSFFPFSDLNYGILMRGKTLEEYIHFFAEHYAAKAPALIQRWKVSKADDEKIAKAEDAAVEKAAGAGSQDDAVQEMEKEKEVFEDKTTQEGNIPMKKEEEKGEKETDEQTVPDTLKEQEITSDNIGEEDSGRKKEENTEEADSVKNIHTGDSSLIGNEDLLPEDHSVEESPKAAKPKEITLEDLLERSKQRELEEEERKAEEEQLKKEKQKEAEELRKQKAKEREQLRKQKEKDAKERLKQKEKERKEKERENRNRQKEREAQRKAAQKEKETQRKAALKDKETQRQPGE
jgi:tetratricopeptide (TPR) repeat protein